MPRYLSTGIKLAAAFLAVSLIGNSTGSNAFSVKVMDHLVLDFSDFHHCFDYATLGGKAVAFACGASTTAQIEQGDAGKTLAFSGRWRVHCPGGSYAYSAPYTYQITLSSAGSFTHPVLGSKNPCTNIPMQNTSFGGEVTQETSSSGGITTYRIRVVTNRRWLE